MMRQVQLPPFMPRPTEAPITLIIIVMSVVVAIAAGIYLYRRFCR